jgi:DNA (cytosine-5)-methyltransferase 1
MKTIPLIDIFAGPGGLSEGFSRYESSDLKFEVALSIEKDPIACETLRIRSFFRMFPRGKAPSAYYRYIKGDRSALAEITVMPEWRAATDHVRNWTLGQTPPREVHAGIRSALGESDKWVLLGGPPCQAYSLVGRSRMTGAGRKDGIESELVKTKKELEFAKDHRHTLYRQYLQILAIQQPPIFVMENVKGILSARLPSVVQGRTARDGHAAEIRYVPAFAQILRDLEDPCEAIKSEHGFPELKLLKKIYSPTNQGYRIYPFVRDDRETGDLFEKASERHGSDFVIRSERFGIPQSRHRVILLGIRQDQDTVAPDFLHPHNAPVTVRQIIGDMPRVRSGVSGRGMISRSLPAKSEGSHWCKCITTVVSSIDGREMPEEVTRLMQSVSARTSSKLDRGGAYIEVDSESKLTPRELSEFIRDKKLGGVIQHEARTHMQSDLVRYLYMASYASAFGESPRLESWPEELLPKHRNVLDNIKSKRGGTATSGEKLGFNDRFRVQLWDRPSTTITSHISKDGHYFIHPDYRQCRSLTVREAARLQTFPDNYFFSGNRTQQFVQVGNAVPPYLAFQLANVVSGLFRKVQKK